MEHTSTELGNQITAVGLVLFVFFLAVKELFSWLKQKSLLNTESRIAAIETGQAALKLTYEKNHLDLQPFLKQIDEMYDWHNKSDQDGVKIWYIRQSLENILRDNASAIGILAKNSELQTNLLKEMIDGQKSIIREQMNQSQEFKILTRRNNEDQ